MCASVSTFILGNLSPIWVIGPLMPVLFGGNLPQIGKITDEIVSAADEIVSVTDRKGKIMSEIQEIAQHIQDFPALVRKARMDKGITNEELAELSGISYSAVCKMQSGERDPKLYDAVAIMKALGLSADQAFDVQQPDSAPSAMQQRIHELELDNAVNTGDVARLTQVNDIYAGQLEDERRQKRFYRRWSLCSSLFGAVLSLALAAYLFCMDMRIPDAGLIRHGEFSAAAYLVTFLIAAAIVGACLLAYRSLCERAKEMIQRK